MYESLSFIDALEKINGNSAEQLVLRQALVTGTIVSYVRPFTKSKIPSGKTLIALDGLPPPQDSALTEEHLRIMALRHKMVGHKDASSWIDGMDGPNRVVIARDNTGYDIHTIVLQGFDSETATRLRNLCGHYAALCEVQLKPVVKKYHAELLELAPGKYELSIKDAPYPWIVPSAKSILPWFKKT